VQFNSSGNCIGGAGSVVHDVHTDGSIHISDGQGDGDVYDDVAVLSSGEESDESGNVSTDVQEAIGIDELANVGAV